MAKQKKKPPKKASSDKIALVTAFINLIIAIVTLIKALTE